MVEDDILMRMSIQIMNQARWNNITTCEYLKMISENIKKISNSTNSIIESNGSIMYGFATSPCNCNTK
jgi:hypothetical protein